MSSWLIFWACLFAFIWAIEGTMNPKRGKGTGPCFRCSNYGYKGDCDEEH